MHSSLVEVVAARIACAEPLCPQGLLTSSAVHNACAGNASVPPTQEAPVSPIWLIVLVLLILAVAGGFAVSKFLFLILIIVVILALVGGRGSRV
jgi:hypothetical protein